MLWVSFVLIECCSAWNEHHKQTWSIPFAYLVRVLQWTLVLEARSCWATLAAQFWHALNCVLYCDHIVFAHKDASFPYYSAL